ncbi:MAG: enoyl-CoA hydratase/isomerase family protein [Candidatus Lokiarchaeota archaeon]|nr:enoyl-CoA hydratase/isomerase family protein [Candidatus Lokiarchaeota archaeon]
MNIEDFEDIIYEKEENGICTITFNRPKRRNALSYVSFLEIWTALDDMEKDKNARVLIMTGSTEGRAFSSGGYFNMSKVTTTPEEIMKEIDLTDIAQKKTCMKFWNFNKPVIAAINGLAIGAGITMPLVGADLIYMSDDPETYLWINFVKRGIAPEFGLSFILPFYLGFQKAKEIIYFGDKISAKEAEKLGLINKALPPEDLMPFVRKQAERLIPPKAPSLSLKLMKKTMHDYFREIISDTLDKENETLRALFKTHDMRESTKSLMQKREPIFKGK